MMKIINRLKWVLKWLLITMWALAAAGIVIGIPYRIWTVGWDEFVRPAREAMAEEAST